MYSEILRKAEMSDLARSASCRPDIRERGIRKGDGRRIIEARVPGYGGNEAVR